MQRMRPRQCYQIDDAQLANGMRLIVNPDYTAPGVAVNLWYRVGSADERPGATGFAHLFEHLMFAGSAQVKNGEHLAAIQAVGGSVNATTSFERTNYYETVAPQALELALWLESERMTTLMVDQENLDTQREVVKEEKRQRYDNVPYGDLLQLLLELNFPEAHPYRHPVIGSMADLDAATLTDVQAFYRSWYQPATAVLTLSGAIGVDAAHELAERYFGELPAAAAPERAQPPELAAHSGSPELVVARDVPRPMLQLCWRSPRLDHSDRIALDLAIALLCDGQSARLHRRLVRGMELAEGVGGYDLGLARGSSVAVISARPRADIELEALREPILQEIAALGDTGPTMAELNRVRAGYEREWLSALAPIEQRADQLGYYATHFNDPDKINRELDEIAAVSIDDIARVTRGWLAPATHAVLRYQQRTTR